MKHFAVFDFDGTIIKSEEGIFDAFRQTFTGLEREVPDRETLMKCIGPGARDSMRILFPKEDETYTDRALVLFRQAYDTESYKQTEIYAGIWDMLVALKSKELPLFIATNKSQGVTGKILEYLKLDQFFVAYKGAEPAFPSKTKGQKLRELYEDFNLEASKGVLVGDTRFDIDAANEVGTPALAVSYGYETKERLEVLPIWKLAESPSAIAPMLLEKFAL